MHNDVSWFEPMQAYALAGGGCHLHLWLLDLLELGVLPSFSKAMKIDCPARWSSKQMQAATTIVLMLLFTSN